MLGKAIRLIAVTSRDEPEERERSRVAGFDRHLVKPVSPNQVTRRSGKCSLAEMLERG